MVETMNDQHPEATRRSQTLRMPETVTHVDVMGTSDQSLRILEKGFPATRISVSGETIYLNGPDEDLPLVGGIIEEMIEAARAGAPLDSQTIAEAVSILRSPEVTRPRSAVGLSGRFVRAKSPGQQSYLDAIDSHQVSFGIGPAGTGKTYLAMAKAVEALLSGAVRRLVLTRPAVEAGENLGFLPGSLTDKIDPYLRPLYDALQDLLEEGALPRLMEAGAVEVAPLAYMRGRTLNDSFVIVDEAQNTTTAQMKMLLTRLGNGSKLVVTGDITQVDLGRGQRSGLTHAEDVLRNVEGIAFCYLTSADVVRTQIVADIVDAYEEWDARHPNSGEDYDRHRRRGNRDR